MKYCVRLSTCEELGICLKDIRLTQTEDGCRICGHMERVEGYPHRPGREVQVVGDLTDEEGGVLASVAGWHQGIFSELGFSTFTVYLDGRYLTEGAEWVELYVTLVAAE